MRTALAVFVVLLSSSPVAAQTLSPEACRVLAGSAERAAASIGAATENLGLDEALLPSLAPEAASAMIRVLRAEKEAKAKVLAYTSALQAFADALKALRNARPD